MQSGLRLRVRWPRRCGCFITWARVDPPNGGPSGPTCSRLPTGRRAKGWAHSSEAHQGPVTTASPRA
eukprot:15284531-Alexandrium_andersonii.AAC.1